MNLHIETTPEQLGKEAAALTAALLRQAIAENGHARLVLSTGSSQFETLKALVMEEVDWSRVTMFHLDEYVNLPETHPASFRKYLKERFLEKVTLDGAYLVDGRQESIPVLTAELRRAPVDVGLIGIGENAHIAFNDPPADFETREAYIVVNLNERCKQQQVGEGWFSTVEEVPAQAISMTSWQIMQCRHIISAVPHKVKAKAVADTMNNETTPLIPATLLKTHPHFDLFLDEESASLLEEKL
jgi:glucosamine-6-phosphate deaminase